MSRFDRPRVALCTDGVYPQALGGMQRHSRLLAEHLARRGKVRLTVLHPHAENVFDPALGIEEVRVGPINTDRLYLHELWKYSGNIARELDRLKPDAILSQGFCVWKGIDRFGDRLIVMPHGLEMFQGLSERERLLGWPFRKAIRSIVRRSAVVISLGGKLTGMLEELTEGSKCRVVVIPNATEVPDPTPDNRQLTTDNRLSLLFVGRFAFNKGIDVLMTVADRLVKEGREGLVRFQLAGDGPLMEQYRTAGLPPNVDLLGRVDDARLAQLYRECDALILPTRFEGMPTVVLEAMAQARPVIVSDVGASAELVDSTNGFLLPPGDADALYHAVIGFAARSSTERQAMGDASYQRVKDRFDWPVVTERFEEVIAAFPARD